MLLYRRGTSSGSPSSRRKTQTCPENLDAFCQLGRTKFMLQQGVRALHHTSAEPCHSLQCSRALGLEQSYSTNNLSLGLEPLSRLFNSLASARVLQVTLHPETVDGEQLTHPANGIRVTRLCYLGPVSCLCIMCAFCQPSEDTATAKASDTATG